MPLCRSETQFKEADEWRVRGPFRRQIAQNGRHESFSSSTDPSFYRNTSMEDTFDDEDIDSGSQTPVPGHDCQSPSLIRTPSLVDELLSEIYARFGNGLTSRSFDSSQRASASGSQVRKTSSFDVESFVLFLSAVNLEKRHLCAETTICSENWMKASLNQQLFLPSYFSFLQASLAGRPFRLIQF